MWSEKKLKSVAPNLSLGTHSLRAGGITTAANTDSVSERCLMRHGRWKTETCKKMYVEDSVDKKLKVTKALALWKGLYNFWYIKPCYHLHPIKCAKMRFVVVFIYYQYSLDLIFRSFHQIDRNNCLCVTFRNKCTPSFSWATYRQVLVERTLEHGLMCEKSVHENQFLRGFRSVNIVLPKFV